MDLSRSDAILLGKPRYQGAPCKRGHSGLRYTSSRICVECGRSYRNVLKARVKGKQWRIDNKERLAVSRRAQTVRKKYGLMLCDLLHLLESQEYKCAICRIQIELEKSHVDHDHCSGKVRGVLCKTCNTGLGNFKDSPIYLRTAAAYIEEHFNDPSHPELRNTGK